MTTTTDWRLPDANRDENVRRCLAGYSALGVTRFDVGIGHWREDGTKGPFWSKEREHNLCRTQVEKRFRWFGRLNARGADIYIRPHGLASWAAAFFDDLTESSAQAIAVLYRALVIETSPGSFHALVATDRPLTMAERHVVQTCGLELLRTHTPDGGGDPSSSAGNKFSRLAGFANSKPIRRREDGRPQWVKVVAMPRIDGKLLRIADLMRDSGPTAQPSLPPRSTREQSGGGGGAALHSSPFATGRKGTSRVGRPGRIDTGYDDSDSGKDFREVCKRLRARHPPDDVERWLCDEARQRRRRKYPGEAERYAKLTVDTACERTGIPRNAA